MPHKYCVERYARQRVNQVSVPLIFTTVTREVFNLFIVKMRPAWPAGGVSCGWVIRLVVAVVSAGAAVGEPATAAASTAPAPATSRRKDIWLLGLFPFNGSWAGGLGQLPAVQMGLTDVNADPYILPDYTISLTVNNTGVSTIPIFQLPPYQNTPPKKKKKMSMGMAIMRFIIDVLVLMSL